MRRLLTLCLITFFVASSSLALGQQDEAARQYEDAYFAWDSGDFAEGIEGFLRLLDGPAADRYFDDIAVLTGELYVTEEVAPDGRNIRISPDGRFAAYDATFDGQLTTHLTRIETGQTLRIDGTGLIFAPAGSLVAYLAISDSKVAS